MTPPELDVGQVTNRLRTIRQTLDELEELRGIGAARLEAEPLTRAAAERLVQVVVDLAVDVNAHVAAARLGVAPATGRASFLAAADAGALDRELADELAPSAGLRNVLVHRYTDIRVEVVAEAIPVLLDGYSAYVHQVAAFLER